MIKNFNNRNRSNNIVFKKYFYVMNNLKPNKHKNNVRLKVKLINAAWSDLNMTKLMGKNLWFFGVYILWIPHHFNLLNFIESNMYKSISVLQYVFIDQKNLKKNRLTKLFLFSVIITKKKLWFVSKKYNPMYQNMNSQTNRSMNIKYTNYYG